MVLGSNTRSKLQIKVISEIKKYVILTHLDKSQGSIRVHVFTVTQCVSTMC